MDGLYWKSASGEPSSPFAAKIADADASGPAPKPFHGYFFKIMTRQGVAAPGGSMDYVKGDGFTGGFALAAYPERWGRSGIMTFIVNQNGKVYQRDLGEKTSKLAAALTEYDPGDGWTLVKDKGVFEEVMRALRARGLPLGLLGLCLASAGCVGFAVGDRDAAAEMDSDPGAFGGYFDGGPARDYRFRGAASRGLPPRIGRRSKIPPSREIDQGLGRESRPS